MTKIKSALPTREEQKNHCKPLYTTITRARKKLINKNTPSFGVIRKSLNWGTRYQILHNCAWERSRFCLKISGTAANSIFDTIVKETCATLQWQNALPTQIHTCMFIINCCGIDMIYLPIWYHYFAASKFDFELCRMHRFEVWLRTVPYAPSVSGYLMMNRATTFDSHLIKKMRNLSGRYI